MNSGNRPISPLSGLPVDLPIAWSSDATNSQASDRSGSFPGTDSTSSPTPYNSGRRHQIGPRKLARLRTSLSPRDRSILELVAAHRYLTTRQLEGFCFHDHASPASAARTARRVLLRLWEHGLLEKLDRRIGGIRAGSASYIWQLGTVGHRLLREDGNAKRTHEPSPRFLAHCLAVADAHLALLAAERACDIKSLSVECEPECWRRFTGPAGERRLLQPDLFVVSAQARYTDRWFIEVDLGTESLATLLGKCTQYEDYRRSGAEQSSAGVFPLVVWQMTTPQRLDKLASAVARSSKLLPDLFRFVLPPDLAPLIRGGAV